MPIPDLIEEYFGTISAMLLVVAFSLDSDNKGIGDAGSSADIIMLWSTIVCYSLPWSAILYFWYF